MSERAAPIPLREMKDKMLRQLAENPESLEETIDSLLAEWIVLRADKERLDTFLFYGACISDEGWHPQSREEFDEMIEKFRAEQLGEEQSHE
jgi:hypothetical protein